MIKRVFANSAEQDAYNIGYKDGKTLTKSDWVKSLVFIVFVAFMSSWLTYVVSAPVPLKRQYSDMSVEQMITHYETTYGKKLSDWRKSKIKKDCSGLNGDEAWRVVKRLGDEI